MTIVSTEPKADLSPGLWDQITALRFKDPGYEKVLEALRASNNQPMQLSEFAKILGRRGWQYVYERDLNIINQRLKRLETKVRLHWLTKSSVYNPRRPTSLLELHTSARD